MSTPIGEEWGVAGPCTSLTGPTTESFHHDGSLVCAGREWPVKTIHCGRETVAFVVAPEKIPHGATGDWPNGPDVHRLEEYARLIAAAPKMLEALQNIAAWLMTDENGQLMDDSAVWRDDFRKALSTAKAAIAKATGAAE